MKKKSFFLIIMMFVLISVLGINSVYASENNDKTANTEMEEGKETFLLEDLLNNKEEQNKTKSAASDTKLKELLEKDKQKEAREQIKEYGEFEEIQDNLESLSQYYEGMIYFAKRHMDKLEENFIIDFAEKLHAESSIVIVDDKNPKRNPIEKNLAEILKNEIGLRINTLLLDTPRDKQCIVNENEIVEDIVELLLRLKNTTGMAIETDGGKIEFGENGKTENLEIGKFYRALNHCFRRLNKESYLWCASTMLEDEWTEEPQEMKFRQINLEVANRGVNVERIFIFSKDKMKEFRQNKTLKIYMQSNIKTLFVDYNEIKEKEPKLLEIVGAGWDGINKEILIADLPEGMKERGYISKNPKEVMEAYNCFQKLKTYSKNLKEVLK